MSETASRKLSYTQFVCALFIIGLHTAFSRHFTTAPGWATDINTFTRMLFDTATSTYFFLSAVLLYRRGDTKDYLTLVVRKIKTLLVPMVLWNTLFFAHQAVRQYLTYRTWPHISIAILYENLLRSPVNLVFWFIQVLFGFVVFFPLILWAVRHKWPAILAALIALTLNLIPGMGIRYASMLFWLPCYLTGAYVGYHHTAWFQQTPIFPKKRSYLPVTVVWLLLIYMGLLNDSAHYLYWQLAPIPAWILADVLIKLPKARWWVDASFYLFASHLLFESYIVKIYQHVLGTGTLAFVAANVLLPCLCAAVALLCAAPVRAWLPRVYAFFTGGRSTHTMENVPTAQGKQAV